MLKSNNKKHHYENSNGTDDADKDYVHCLLSCFPNADDNPAEYVSTKDTIERAVSMETHLKVISVWEGGRDTVLVVTMERLVCLTHYQQDWWCLGLALPF